MFTKGKLEGRWWHTLPGLPAHRSRCASLFVTCSSVIRFSHEDASYDARRQLWWSIQGWEQVGISSTWARVMDGLYLFFLAGRYRVQKELFVRPLEIKLRRWSWLWNFKSGPAFGPAYRTFWSHLVYQTRLPILVVRLSFDFLLCLCRSVHAALNTCGGSGMFTHHSQFLSASCLWGW